MDAKNLSWGIMSFGIGLIVSVVAIVVLAVMDQADPVAIGALAAIANGALVGLGTAMNPNKKFDESSKELQQALNDLTTRPMKR